MSGYVLRLFCGCLVCALVQAICDRQIVKLLCGVYLAGLVLSPVADFDWKNLDISDIRREAETAVEAGQAQAADAFAAGIKERAEAYILDEAAALGLTVSAEVTVEAGLPAAVEVTGALGPGDRERLSGVIARNLGIGKEAQTWISPYQRVSPPG